MAPAAATGSAVGLAQFSSSSLPLLQCNSGAGDSRPSRSVCAGLAAEPQTTALPLRLWSRTGMTKNNWTLFAKGTCGTKSSSTGRHARRESFLRIFVSSFQATIPDKLYWKPTDIEWSPKVATTARSLTLMAIVLTCNTGQRVRTLVNYFNPLNIFVTSLKSSRILQKTPHSWKALKTSFDGAIRHSYKVYKPYSPETFGVNTTSKKCDTETFTQYWNRVLAFYCERYPWK